VSGTPDLQVNLLGRLFGEPVVAQHPQGDTVDTASRTVLERAAKAPTLPSAVPQSNSVSVWTVASGEAFRWRPAVFRASLDSESTDDGPLISERTRSGCRSVQGLSAAGGRCRDRASGAKGCGGCGYLSL
jgi:hypothetical protein